MVMFKVLDALKVLRLSKEGEQLGMDLDQHGISAYPEYVITGNVPHPAGTVPAASTAVPNPMPREAIN